MKEKTPEVTSPSPWDKLKKYTTARIALGRCGTSLPTTELLDFQLCHARARDAVHTPLDFEKLGERVKAATGLEVIILNSMIKERMEYLRRPDLGKRLSPESADLLKRKTEGKNPDISITIADGLSSSAVDQNAAPFLEMFIPKFKKAGYTIAPISLIKQGRVAVADEISYILGTKLSIILIGERPGLKSANSMGIYITYMPEPGTGDERRNCISNIRPEGLPISAGVSKLLYLTEESLKRKISGVNLKDEQTGFMINDRD